MQINLTGSLRSSANGEAVVEINASTIRELLRKLLETYPGMEEYMELGIAVSIDGEIYRDSPSKKLPVGSEIFLLPRLQGG